MISPDEKIGGTVHLALGKSYPETGAKNQSALHWDLILDLRKGGRRREPGDRRLRTTGSPGLRRMTEARLDWHRRTT
jgi:hypothetical protein